MINCILCEISCSNYQVLSRHLSKHHDMTSKEYYDKYLKQPNESICPVCGKETAYRGLSNGYLTHCSSKCARLDPLVKNKTEQTNINRYGCKVYVKSKDFYDKTIKTNNEKYGNDWFTGSTIGKNRIINTNQTKYNANYPLENSDIKKKSEQTQIDKYGSQYMNLNEFKQKSKETNTIKYGSDYYIKTKEFSKKSYETKRKNKRCGMQTEDNCYIILNSIYKTERQYKTDEYPYHCDFYINDLNLYIELNFFWTHNKHWFNSNDQNDLTTLNLWTKKSKEHSIYKSAVTVWSIMDLDKRNCAIKNNLNYVVVWNIEQFNKFVVDLTNHKIFKGFIDYNITEE